MEYGLQSQRVGLTTLNMEEHGCRIGGRGGMSEVSRWLLGAADKSSRVGSTATCLGAGSPWTGVLAGLVLERAQASVPLLIHPRRTLGVIR